ncbi:hypothetical protein CAC42_5920 [Sphaceloma murrayae]|uniref:Uncharacterized protein n=1 Tax=Sphaceloma murrayae TaxID=2082308 RepID=A0A2K1QZM6_9PEZI|nr:hypothetical protein CAC42_5920 [Sphaceloma murrayae]
MAQVRGSPGQASTRGGITIVKILTEIPLTSVGLSEWSFANALLRAAIKPYAGVSDKFDGEEYFNMISTLTRRPSYNDYLDSDIWASAVRETYQRLGAQYAKLHMTRPTEAALEGSLINEGPRLFVETLTLRLMDAFLIVFAACALSICLFFNFPGLPRDYSSVGALALLFSQSPDFMRLCSGLGSVRLTPISTWMSGYRFRTKCTITENRSSYRLCADLDSSVADVNVAPDVKQGLKWWCPLMFTRAMRIMTIVSPLLLIAGLEAGHRYSRRKQGFSAVPQEGYLKYAWAFLPAIVMVGMASTFAVLDFATRSFQIYHALSGRRKATARDLVETPFGHFPIYSVFRTGIHRQWALMATSLAICVSPMLTIVVSGLFQVESIDTWRSGMAAVHDTFLPSTINNYALNNDASQRITGLLLYANVSFPSLTYENLVFPNFTLERNATHHHSARFQAILPAASVESNCTVVDPGTMTWNTTFLNATVAGLQGQINVKGRRRCSHVQNSDNATVVADSIGWSLDNIPLSGDPTWATRVDKTAINATCDGQPYGYLFAVGRNSPQNVSNLVLINCKPRIDITSANVTTRAGSYEITNATVLEDTPRRLFSKYLKLFDTVTVACPDGVQNVTSVGCIKEALTTYPHIKLTQDEIFASSDAAKVAKAFTRMMNIVWAMRFTYYQRASLEQSPSAGVFVPAATRVQAVILDGVEYRVVQSLTSTRILQSELATLAVCALVAWSCTRSNKVLTKNPQSIAAVASLLVDSDMLRNIPPGAEFMTDKELEKNGVLEGEICSIGWWGKDQGRRFGIDVGQAEKPK